jgi:hypothetical protein
MTTRQDHTHRFDDNGTCERCGATYTEVVAARQAATTSTQKDKARRDLDAVAAENDRKDRAANRRTYYERTGR